MQVQIEHQDPGPVGQGWAVVIYDDLWISWTVATFRYRKAAVWFKESSCMAEVLNHLIESNPEYFESVKT